jgi:hypothetical protein
MSTPESSAPEANRRPHTYWWLASVACPVLGLVGDALGTLSPRTETLGWLVLSVACLFGFLACLRSLRSRERLALLSLVSGIPCALILLGLLVLVVSSLVSETGARHF